MANKLSMPLASWEALKKIVRAYGQVENLDKPTVEDVAKYAGMLRPVVSSNNNFLRETGFLIEGENKLTPLGLRLSECLALDSEDLVAETLQEIVKANPVLNQFVGIVRARGGVKTDLLKGEIALASNLADRTKQPGATKAILDMLQEANLIQVSEDIVKPEANVKTAFTDAMVNRFPAPAEPFIEDNRKPQMDPWAAGKTPPRIPLPLGPSRLAYIQLPEDWSPKELGKLIKILQLALGEDEAP